MGWRFTGLWRHSDFMKLWAGQTISAFGSHITWQALPLTAVLVLAASPTELGLLAAIEAAPVLLVGLLAGAWVDRRRRRPIMIGCDLGRALLLASIPLAAIFGALSMAQLYLVAGLTGVLTVFFNVADRSYLPTLLPREELVEGNSKLSASSSIAEITGQPFGGLLVQLITAPFAIAADALSFLLSAFCINLIGKPEPQPAPPEQRENLVREALEGLRFVFGNLSLRALTFCSMQRSFFGNFIGPLYMVFVIRDLQMPVWVTGVLVGIGGISSLLGAALASCLTQRLGIGKALIGSCLLVSLLAFLIPLAGGPLWLALGLMILSQLGDAGWAIFHIGETSLLQALAPEHQLGRVNASNHFLTGGLALFGAILGGALGDLIGVRATLLVAVVGLLLSVFWLVYSPIRQTRQLPTLSENEPEVEKQLSESPVT